MPSFSAALDVLWPTPCPHCGSPASRALRTRLCEACTAALPSLLCWAPPPPNVWTAFSLGRYQGPLGALIRRGKHRPDDAALAEAAGLLARAARGRLPDADAVCCVPTTPARLWTRGLNPARRLAKPVARALRRPFLEPLQRHGQGSQVGRTASQRWAAATQQFRAEGPITGTWLLVDDVWTTGATAAACATELLGAGAERVILLTATRAERREAAVSPNCDEPVDNVKNVGQSRYHFLDANRHLTTSSPFSPAPSPWHGICNVSLVSFCTTRTTDPGGSHDPTR